LADGFVAHGAKFDGFVIGVQIAKRFDRRFDSQILACFARAVLRPTVPQVVSNQHCHGIGIGFDTECRATFTGEILSNNPVVFTDRRFAVPWTQEIFTTIDCDSRSTL
jgi:hypothetical protein